jgi:hypothetical protein
LNANNVFNFAYAMMLAAFPNQACQMDLRVGSAQLSGAVFSLGDAVAIIVYIPIFDNFLFPAIERCKRSPISNRHKLLGGFFFAGLAMIAATLIEWERRGSDILTPTGLMPVSDFKKGHLPTSWACPEGSSSPCNVAGGDLMGKSTASISQI